MFFKAVHHIWKSVFSVLWYRGLKSLIPDSPSLVWSICSQAGCEILHWEKKSQSLIRYCPRKVYWTILHCRLWRISRNAPTRVCRCFHLPQSTPLLAKCYCQVKVTKYIRRNFPDLTINMTGQCLQMFFFRNYFLSFAVKVRPKNFWKREDKLEPFSFLLIKFFLNKPWSYASSKLCPVTYRRGWGVELLA